MTIITIERLCPWCGKLHQMPAVSLIAFPKRWVRRPPTPAQVAKRAARMKRPGDPLGAALAAARLCHSMQKHAAAS